MLKRFKIKSQVFFLTALTLCIITLLQIILYSLLQHESDNTISTVFDSVAQNTAFQIEKLNDDIEELSSLLAVNDIVQSCLYEYSPAEVIRNMDSIQNLLLEYRERNQNIAFLGIVKDKSLFMSSESVNLYEDVRRLISSIPEHENSDSIFLPSFIYDGRTYFACITPIFPVNISYYSPAYTGRYIICLYEMNSVSYAPYVFIDNSRIGLIVTDDENRVMLSAEPENHGREIDLNQKLENFLYRTISISKPNWNVTVFMPSDNVLNFSYLSRFFIGAMIFITIAMLFIMLKLLNDIIIKKIVFLKENVEKISDNDTTYRIRYDYNDELREIVTVINRVLETIHSLNQDKLKTLDSLYKAQLLQKETQILYLHGQVSPHFLYNSMSYIQGIAFQYNATEIVHMTSSLSKVFRYFSSNLALSTIQQDLDCAIEYFNVINMRRENPIIIENKVDKDLLGVRCLKMIYQPILENVLKHAFGVDDTGKVAISSVFDEKKAIIEITDNGSGISSDDLDRLRRQMSENDLSHLQNKEHIGLLNVNIRLKLYYNKDCGIEIYSRDNDGTTVRIIFDKEPPSKPDVSESKP